MVAADTALETPALANGAGVGSWYCLPMITRPRDTALNKLVKSEPPAQLFRLASRL